MNYLNNEQIRDMEARLDYLSLEEKALLAKSANKEKTEMSKIEKAATAALEESGEQLSLLDLDGDNFNWGPVESTKVVFSKDDNELRALALKNKHLDLLTIDKKKLESLATSGELDPEYGASIVTQESFKWTKEKGGKK